MLSWKKKKKKSALQKKEKCLKTSREVILFLEEIQHAELFFIRVDKACLVFTETYNYFEWTKQ